MKSLKSFKSASARVLSRKEQENIRGGAAPCPAGIDCSQGPGGHCPDHLRAPGGCENYWRGDSRGLAECKCTCRGEC